MQNRPTAAELLDAVRELLSTEVLPTITDDGLRFKTLIAANVLAIVGRELTTGEPLLREELDRLLQLPLRSESSDALNTADGTFVSVTDQITALNRQLADTIRTIPAESPEAASIRPSGDIWAHVKQTLRDQLTVSNPKFVL